MVNSDIDRLSWRPLHGTDAAQVHEARLQAHHAVQWLARAARGYVPAQPDDGHTNLGCDDALQGFVTHSLRGGSLLGLRIADLTLNLKQTADAAGSGATASLALAGRTDAQVRQWLGEQLRMRGLNPEALDAPSPYAMPPHPIADGGAYQTAEISDALAALAGWYGNAATSLEQIRRDAATRSLDASPVRCWPHHFDIATLITIPAHNAGGTGYVGAGLSPGDGYYDEPYFYVSVYPKPDLAALPPLPVIAHWHTRDFTAGVATSQSILGTSAPQAEVAAYLQTAVDGAIALLDA